MYVRRRSNGNVINAMMWPYMRMWSERPQPEQWRPFHSSAVPSVSFEPSTVAPFTMHRQLVSKWNSVSKSLIRKSCPLRCVVVHRGRRLIFLSVSCCWSGFKRYGVIRKQLIDDFSSGRMCCFFVCFQSTHSSWKRCTVRSHITQCPPRPAFL